MLAHSVDLAFVRSPMLPDRRLMSHVFLTEGFHVAVPRDHPLARSRTIKVAALREQPLIMPRSRRGGGEVSTGLAVVLMAEGAKPRVTQEPSEYVTTVNLVAAGVDVTVVPSVLVGRRGDRVAYRPLASDPALFTQLLVVSRAGDPSPAVTNILSSARAAARTMPPASDMMEGGSISVARA